MKNFEENKIQQQHTIDTSIKQNNDKEAQINLSKIFDHENDRFFWYGNHFLNKLLVANIKASKYT